MAKKNEVSRSNVPAVDPAEIGRIVKSLADEVIQFFVGTVTQLDYLLDAVYPHLTTLDYDNKDDDKYRAAEYKRCQAEIMAIVEPELRSTIVSLFTKAATGAATRESVVHAAAPKIVSVKQQARIDEVVAEIIEGFDVDGNLDEVVLALRPDLTLKAAGVDGNNDNDPRIDAIFRAQTVAREELMTAARPWLAPILSAVFITAANKTICR